MPICTSIHYIQEYPVQQRLSISALKYYIQKCTLINSPYCKSSTPLTKGVLYNKENLLLLSITGNDFLLTSYTFF